MLSIYQNKLHISKRSRCSPSQFFVFFTQIHNYWKFLIQIHKLFIFNAMSIYYTVYVFVLSMQLQARKQKLGGMPISLFDIKSLFCCNLTGWQSDSALIAVQ